MVRHGLGFALWAAVLGFAVMASGEEPAAPDAPDETACNNDGEDGWPGTCPVGRLAGDRSWCGAQDMAGNVREWCMDDGRGTLAGGSFERSIDRCVVDDPRGYTQRSDQVGFRFLVEARR